MPIFYIGRGFSSPTQFDPLTDQHDGRAIRYAPFFDPAKIPAFPIKIMRPDIFADPDERRNELRIISPRLIDYGSRRADARGLYRVFNAAAYRFYRSNLAPPTTADTPFTTSATLPNTPASTFADGTWYVSMSYFNGVLDSGFLPVGPHGETYLKLVITGGVAAAAKPTQPYNARLSAGAAGVLQILAFYAPVVDGANSATEWAIAYTIDGSAPAVGTPTITRAMSTGPIQVLSYKLPAQADGTTVKVQLQVRRGIVYSDPLVVLQATAVTAGPEAPLSVSTWPGTVPEVAP